MSKKTGKASAMSFGGTTLPITKYTPKVNLNLVEATDSTNYDAGTDTLYEDWLSAKFGMELAVEGKYNSSTIPSSLIANIFAGVATAAVVLNRDAGDLFGHGNFKISDYQEDVPVDDIITYTCNLKIIGKFTPNA